MGRIQRKKAPGTKKRKKQQSAGETGTRTVETPAGDSSRPSGSADTAKGAGKLVATVKKPTVPAAATAVKAPRDNIFTKSIQFLREVKVELKKVTWPSRKQAIGSTAVVIALVMLISLFLGVVDMGLSSLVKIVLQ